MGSTMELLPEDLRRGGSGLLEWSGLTSCCLCRQLAVLDQSDLFGNPLQRTVIATAICLSPIRPH